MTANLNAFGHDPLPWKPPPVTHTHTNAPAKHAVDLRWREQPAPEFPEAQDPRERTARAVTMQCSNARVPGYKGFIPSSRAEDICAGTAAAVGQRAAVEQHRRKILQEERLSRNSLTDSTTRFERESPAATFPAPQQAFGDEHPLGKSRTNIARNHWVPTIPGYGGYIPGKYAENICGGGMSATCQMAGRAIAERQPPLDELEPTSGRSGMNEAHETIRVASHLREHCSSKIPGYSGHIPRKHGESLFGATMQATNLIAADMCEDRAMNPDRHFHGHCAPQFPRMRSLRS